MPIQLQPRRNVGELDAPEPAYLVTGDLALGEKVIAKGASAPKEFLEFARRDELEPVRFFVMRLLSPPAGFLLNPAVDIIGESKRRRC